MFVRYENINNRKVIDVRTKTEFINMNMTEFNIPIINEEEHKVIKKFYPTAFFIIVKGIIINRREIRRKLLQISNNGKEQVIIACSRGRLRSPIVYFYARFLGIRCKVLWGGLKKRYWEEKNLKNNFKL